MRGALRIALAYFSGAALMSWLSLIGAVMVGAGLLFAVLSRSAAFSSGSANFAQFGILALVLGPAYNGGAWMRDASTPTIMHLRPHGRRQMLLGATLTVTLIAALFTLHAVIANIWPLGYQGSIAFGLAPVAMFQFAWGGAALLWVATFALSSRPMLLAFSWIPLFAVFILWNWLDTELPFTREQLPILLFAAGIAAWVAFAPWYLQAPNVLRRKLLNAESGEQSLVDSAGLIPERWIQRAAAGDTRAACTAAVRQYLVGAYSARNCLAIGAALTLLYAAGYYLTQFDPPLTGVLIMSAFIGATMGAMCVPRARLLWLRAGLDRSALFATAERLALKATFLFVAIPVVAAVTKSVLEQPPLAAAIVLHAATQMAFAASAVFAGITYTRGAPQIFVLFVVLGLPAFVALIKLEPHKVSSPWLHIGALLVISTLALVLRHLARRTWLSLDWRLTGSSLQRGLR